MKQILENVVKALVEDADQVKVEETTDSEGTKFTISVAEADKGRVIGKQGHTVQALRNLAQTMGTRKGTRVSIEIA